MNAVGWVHFMEWWIWVKTFFIGKQRWVGVGGGIFLVGWAEWTFSMGGWVQMGVGEGIFWLGGSG